MCNCRFASDPETGEPEAVLHQAKYFPDTQHPTVAVDACIADVIESLWRAGIRTTHSCCGHNGKYGPASVGLDLPEDTPAAAAILRPDGRMWRIFSDIAAGSRVT